MGVLSQSAALEQNGENKRPLSAVINAAENTSPTGSKKIKGELRINGNNAMVCARCNVSKSKTCFAKGQRKKGANGRCRDCTQADQLKPKINNNRIMS